MVCHLFEKYNMQGERILLDALSSDHSLLVDRSIIDIQQRASGLTSNWSVVQAVVELHLNIKGAYLLHTFRAPLRTLLRKPAVNYLKAADSKS